METDGNIPSSSIFNIPSNGCDSMPCHSVSYGRIYSNTSYSTMLYQRGILALHTMCVQSHCLFKVYKRWLGEDKRKVRAQ